MRTGNRARALYAALLALVVLTQPAHAQQPAESVCLLPEEERPDHPVEPVELCAETTLHASTSRVLRVSLPKQVTIASSFGPEGAIEVQGQGLFIGFVLTKDPLPGAEGRLLLAGRLHREPTPNQLFVTFGDLGSPGATFPPGQYRLYILASGSPVTVTLRLPELLGEMEVTPLTPNRFDVRKLAPRIWEEGARLIYSAGEDGELHTNGLLLQSMWLNTSNHINTRLGTCYYDGPSPEPYAHAPECPEGGGFTFTVTDVGPPRPEESLGAVNVVWGHTPGTYGQGAWYESVSQVSSVGSVVFWLDLE